MLEDDPMQTPIILPDSCLTQTLDPKDFAIANLVLSSTDAPFAFNNVAAAGPARREREAVFSPSKAPWVRNKGTYVQE
jgi:hypothetical protein